MDAITYSAARAKLADTMNRVCEDHEPIIITRNGQQAVVTMSLDDFKALEETSYLPQNPRNGMPSACWRALRRLKPARAQCGAWLSQTGLQRYWGQINFSEAKNPPPKREI